MENSLNEMQSDASLMGLDIEQSPEMSDHSEAKQSKKSEKSNSKSTPKWMQKYQTQLLISKQDLASMAEEEKWDYAVRSIKDLDQMAKVCALLGEESLMKIGELVMTAKSIMEIEEKVQALVDKQISKTFKNTEVQEIFKATIGDDKKCSEARFFINSLGLTGKQCTDSSIRTLKEKLKVKV